MKKISFHKKEKIIAEWIKIHIYSTILIQISFSIHTALSLKP